jgi:hypothetical protein
MEAVNDPVLKYQRENSVDIPFSQLFDENWAPKFVTTNEEE